MNATRIPTERFTNASLWWRDRLFVRLVKNSSTLMGGNAIAGLLGLASLAMTARALGADAFGVLVLITTYVLVVDNLVNFQSWQAVIRYGAGLLHDAGQDDFQSVIKLGLVLDASTAAAATVLAAMGAWVVGNARGWDPDVVALASLYSLTLVFHVAGTPTAVLRLFDRFDLLVYNQVLTAVVKVAGVAVAYAAGGGIWMFVSVWAAVEVIGNVSRIVLAAQELSRRKYTGVLQASLANLRGRFNGLWRFVWTTNVHASVKLALREADILLIGALLGAPAAGTYKIVKALGSRVSKLATPLQQAIYPDLARLAASGSYEDLLGLVRRPMLAVAMVGVVAVCAVGIFGDVLIGTVFGEAYEAATVPMVIYLVGVLVSMITFPFHPTLLALGRAGTSLAILSVSSTVYLVVLCYGAGRFGLAGAAASYVAFYLIWSILMTTVLVSLIRRSSTSAHRAI